MSAGLLTNYAYAISVEQAPCYVSSPECPQGYIDYVNENITKFLIAAEENQATESCYVGTPFAFNDSNSDVFYFPVIQGNDIKYLLRVYPIEDGYSGIISEFLVREINSLANLTTSENPLYLSCNESQIIATVGYDEYVLFEYPVELAESADAAPLAINETSVKNIKENGNIPINPIITRDNPESINLVINYDKNDLQTTDSWCTAHCLSAIIRTLNKGTPTAKDIMTQAYGEGNFTTDTAFPWDNMLSVTYLYGLYPYVLNYLPPDSALINELRVRRPCILAMERNGGRHAVVLRGWNSQIKMWSIWNPWYNFYESFPVGGTYIPTYDKAKVYTAYGAAYKFDGTF